MSDGDSAKALEQVIDRYNAAWNDHDLDAIMSMHAPDMVFHNHTAGESAEGEEAREHIGSIFRTWPDIEFSTRRLYLRDGLVVQEWTATATHTSTMRRGDIVAEPTNEQVRWDGMDVIPFQDGLAVSRALYDRGVEVLPTLVPITLAGFRDALGASRKTAQLLLERYDADGLTRRVGDERVLRRVAKPSQN